MPSARLGFWSRYGHSLDPRLEARETEDEEHIQEVLASGFSEVATPTATEDEEDIQEMLAGGLSEVATPTGAEDEEEAAMSVNDAVKAADIDEETLGSDAEIVLKGDTVVGHSLKLRTASAAVLHGAMQDFGGVEGGGNIR